MPSSAITLEQLRPAWLEETLIRGGSLTAGHVTAIQPVQTIRTRLSHICRFRASYSADARGARPEAFLFKSPRLELLPVGSREVEIYQVMAQRMPNAPLVRCYDAAFDAALGYSHLLLEDKSATHAACHDVAPPRAAAELMVDGLARLHAFWWDHPLLGEQIGHVPTAYDVRRQVGHAACYFGRVVEALGDRLSDSDREVCETVLDAHAPCLAERVQRGPITLIHGDAHASNFLLPQTPGGGSAYLIDWQTPPWVWDCGLGASDLAYLMIRYWPSDHRQALEPHLLARYHQGLLAGGVRGYSPAALWDDYRHGCLLNLYVAIEEAVRTDVGHWRPQLTRVLAAIQDQRALELLNRATRGLGLDHRGSEAFSGTFSGTSSPGAQP